jgi:hypothetical protein
MEASYSLDAQILPCQSVHSDADFTAPIFANKRRRIFNDIGSANDVIWPDCCL